MAFRSVVSQVVQKVTECNVFDDEADRILPGAAADHVYDVAMVTDALHQFHFPQKVLAVDVALIS